MITPWHDGETPGLRRFRSDDPPDAVAPAVRRETGMLPVGGRGTVRTPRRPVRMRDALPGPVGRVLAGRRDGDGARTVSRAADGVRPARRRRRSEDVLGAARDQTPHSDVTRKSTVRMFFFFFSFPVSDVFGRQRD